MELGTEQIEQTRLMIHCFDTQIINSNMNSIKCVFKAVNRPKLAVRGSQIYLIAL